MLMKQGTMVAWRDRWGLEIMHTLDRARDEGHDRPIPLILVSRIFTVPSGAVRRREWWLVIERRLMLVEEAMICSGHIQHHLIPLFVHLAELQLDVLHGSVHLRSPLLELDTRVLDGYKMFLLGTVELVKVLLPLEIRSSDFFSTSSRRNLDKESIMHLHRWS